MNYRNVIDKIKGRKEFIEVQIEDRGCKRKVLKNKLEKVILPSQKFIQEVAVKTQNLIKFRIEKIIQFAVDICFPGEYEFLFEFNINKDKTETLLLFEKNGNREHIKDESGGGLKDILAFSFRIALLSLSHNRKILLLDEPFAALSRDLHNKAGEILKRLSHDLNIQILMSTHNTDMTGIADRVFEIGSIEENNFYKSIIKVLK